MTRGVILLSVFTIAGSAINYASNLVFARLLTPSSYGDLTSLLSLSVVVAVPFTAAQSAWPPACPHMSERVAGRGSSSWSATRSRT